MVAGVHTLNTRSHEIEPVGIQLFEGLTFKYFFVNICDCNIIWQDIFDNCELTLGEEYEICKLLQIKISYINVAFKLFLN